MQRDAQPVLYSELWYTTHFHSYSLLLQIIWPQFFLRPSSFWAALIPAMPFSVPTRHWEADKPFVELAIKAEVGYLWIVDVACFANQGWFLNTLFRIQYVFVGSGFSFWLVYPNFCVSFSVQLLCLGNSISACENVEFYDCMRQYCEIEVLFRLLLWGLGFYFSVL